MRHKKESTEDFLRFRIEPSLVDALDRFAALQTSKTKKRCTRAKAARLLITAGLAGVDSTNRHIALESLVLDVQRAARSAVQKAGADLVRKLPDLVKAELR